MIESRKAHNSVLMADGIYVMGGINGCEYLKSAEKFNFFSKKWEKIPQMKTGRSHSICIRSHDLMYIYLIGGYNKEILNSVERYFQFFLYIDSMFLKVNGIV